MLYTNENQNTFFKECAEYPNIFEFNEQSLLDITNEKFMEELTDKIMTFEIERITVNQKEDCTLIYIQTRSNEIVYGYLNENKSWHSIKCIPSFVLKSLNLTLVDVNQV